MNRRIMAGVIGGIITVAIFMVFVSMQQLIDESDEILGTRLQNANECNEADFKADSSKDTIEITMYAYQWKFDYCSITVYEGQTVTIMLESLDIPHGFAIDGYPEIGSIHISPNAQSVIKFMADKTGTFTYYCTVFCGEGHPLHTGQFVVQSI